jgi:acetyl-CoA synthetase
MIRTIWGDPERFKKSYFGDCEIDGKPVYFSGDGAMVDKDGYITITGRTDDVINVSGHRIGTAEIESAIKKHNNVASVAVVGKPHEIKGEGIFAYIVLKSTPTAHRDEVAGEFETMKEINKVIKNEIGAIALCDDMAFVDDLPKTRSGKIMRRILRKIAANEVDKKALGDTSTLADPSVVDNLIENRLNR